MLHCRIAGAHLLSCERHCRKCAERVVRQPRAEECPVKVALLNLLACLHLRTLPVMRCTLLGLKAAQLGGDRAQWLQAGLLEHPALLRPHQLLRLKPQIILLLARVDAVPECGRALARRASALPCGAYCETQRILLELQLHLHLGERILGGGIGGGLRHLFGQTRTRHVSSMRGRLLCRRLTLPARRSAANSALDRRHWAHAPTLIQARRRAEAKRFGAPAWQILAGGLIGLGFIARWCMQHQPEAWRPRALTDGERLEPMDRITEQRHVEALLSEVRLVLARFGVTLGAVPLRVQLLSESHELEGMTTKIIRPPPLLRGVEALSLRRNLSAISAAQVLAHE